MPDKQATVVITGAGTATCQGVLKALRAQMEIPVRLVVADPDTVNAGRYLADAYERVPFANDPQFVDRLIEICKKYDADLLVPIVDMEFMAIAKRKGDFPCVVSMSAPDALSKCIEKDKTYDVCGELGLRHPKVYAVGNDAAAKFLKDGPGNVFPLFVKPRIGRATIDCYRVDDVTELEIVLRKVDDPLVTENIESGDDVPEMTIDTLSDFEGKFLGGVVRVRLMTKSGVSVKGMALQQPTVLNQAKQIVERIGVVGPACLQCFNTENGSTPAWFEVNPRFGGGTILSVAYGFNSPLALLKLALGQQVDFTGWKPKQGILKMVRYWQEFYTVDGSREETDVG